MSCALTDDALTPIHKQKHPCLLLSQALVKLIHAVCGCRCLCSVITAYRCSLGHEAGVGCWWRAHGRRTLATSQQRLLNNRLPDSCAWTTAVQPVCRAARKVRVCDGERVHDFIAVGKGRFEGKVGGFMCHARWWW